MAFIHELSSEQELLMPSYVSFWKEKIFWLFYSSYDNLIKKRVDIQENIKA